MAKVDDNVFPKVEFAEGAAPATPGASKVRLYAKSDGLLYSKDDAGTETVVTGGGAGSFTFSGARVTKASQSINNAALTKLLFDTEAYDTNAFHDNGSNTERLTIPTTGKYRVSAGAYFGFSESNEVDLLVQLGGTSGGGNAIAGLTLHTVTAKWLNVSFDRDFSATNYLEVEVYHDNGSARAFTLCYFTIQRLDP